MDFRRVSPSGACNMPPVRFLSQGVKISLYYGANKSIQFQVPKRIYRIKKHPFRDSKVIESAHDDDSEYHDFVDALVDKCAVDIRRDIVYGGLVYELDDECIFFNSAGEIVESEISVGSEYLMTMIVDISGGYIGKSGWKIIAKIKQLMVHECTYESRPRIFFSGIDSKSRPLFVND